MIKTIAAVILLTIGGMAYGAPSESACRAQAHAGETWEDACERIYNIAPNAWDPATGKLMKPAKHDSKAVVTAKAEIATAKAHLKAARAADRDARKAKKARAKAAGKAAAARVMADAGEDTEGAGEETRETLAHQCARGVDRPECDDYQREGLDGEGTDSAGAIGGAL